MHVSKRYSPSNISNRVPFVQVDEHPQSYLDAPCRQLLKGGLISGRWNSYTNGSKMSLNLASEDEVEQGKKLFRESQVKLPDF